MESDKRVKLCPCGTGDVFSTCCEPLVNRLVQAPSATALMRSRYTAFTLQRFDYIYASWHPDYRPSLVELTAEPDNRKWLGLNVLKTKKGTATDTTGQVKFEARFEADGQEFVMRELSDFVKLNGAWVYTKGR